MEAASKMPSNKPKNEQVALHQTEKGLLSKGNHPPSEKATHGMGENM